jgi:hydroxymethylpyrimidine/phosphomethylpyrimidine kinase
MHTSFFARWGTSFQDLERTPESSATTAYGAFLIDMGLQGTICSALLGLGSLVLSR